MANGYFERGEIYWAKMGNGLGMEMNVTRPALIVSADKYNSRSDLVVVVFLSLHGETCPRYVETYATGKLSRVLCNQVQSVDKSRFTKLLGTMPYDDMRAVEDALEEVFDLGYADTAAMNEKDREIEALKVKIAELTGEVAREQTKYIELGAKHEDELLSYKVENTMWQKCYDKVLNQLVDMKCMNDLFVRGHLSAEPKLPEVPDLPRKPVKAVVKVIDPEEPVLPVEQPVEPKDNRVDINHCTQTQLKKVGMSDGLARAVVAKRPFQSVADLKNVPGMSKKKYQIFEPKLCCKPLVIIEIPAEPVVPEEPVTEVAEVAEPEVVTEAEGTEGKLNINYVLAKELSDVTGVALTTCYGITKYRKEHGAYLSWDDLRKAPPVSDGVVAKFQDKIVFGPLGDAPKPHRGPRMVAEPTEPYTGEKININTASAQEICDKTGLSKTVCFSIVGCRKRDGNYRSVEDLENVPRFTEYHMKKYGPMFEV